MRERFIRWLKELGRTLKAVFFPKTQEEEIKQLQVFLFVLALNNIQQNKRLNTHMEMISWISEDMDRLTELVVRICERLATLSEVSALHTETFSEILEAVQMIFS